MARIIDIGYAKPDDPIFEESCWVVSLVYRPSSRDRLADLTRFYSILDVLEARLGGARRLDDCFGRMGWPRRGVYFFREDGERRSNSGQGPRVVRVGTHALKAGSRSTLWARLSQHQGQKKGGGGNHRGSIFRLLVGAALIKRDGLSCPTWGEGSSAPSEVWIREVEVERAVSRVIGRMSFVWLGIEDEPGPESRRGFIERNAIALLSSYFKTPLDPPSGRWLGRDCGRERVIQSGLWNSNHVESDYDPRFLDELERLVSRVGAA